MPILRSLRTLLPFFLAPLAPAVAATNVWPNNLVTGTVTFQGAPLAGVNITLWNTNTNSIIQVTATDAEGSYTLMVPAWVDTAGDGADYHIWAMKEGYAFYPSVGPGAAVIRADHTGNLAGNGMTDIALYFTVIHYVAIPNMQYRNLPGPPLTGADFLAYDGTNPLVNLTSADTSARGTASSRFTDNQDGTVTDGVTGLVWLRDAGCFSPSAWGQALAQVNALATGACGLTDGSAAGDWRVPNLNELESLVDPSAHDPALSRGNPFIRVSGGIYWSSTSYFGGEAGSPSAWSIRLADGRFINDGINNNKAAQNAVWAVKGQGSGPTRLQSTGQYVTFAPGDDGSHQAGVPLTFPRWVDKGDGAVVDTVTGLVWLKQADCINGTWSGAESAVRALGSGACGLSDGSQPGSWRMPTRTEMLSLSDRMENNQADFFDHTYYNWDGTLFLPAVFTGFTTYQYYWTATTDAADLTRVWTVFSCDFGVYDTSKLSTGYTLAVRAPADPPARPDIRRPPVRRLP